jgi:diguanylate cyclase (GGDEF)-like protein
VSATPLPTLASRIRDALLGVALAAVAIAAIGALVIGHHTLKRQMQAHLAAVADITAVQSQAPLLFGDAAAATDVLAAIPGEEGIHLGEIRDASGAVLARLEDPSQSLPSLLERALAPGSAVRPVVVDGRRVGTVVLEAGGRPLARNLLVFVVFDVIGGLVMALVVLTVARRLTRHIARPIEALGTVMREVHADRDFARRAPPFAVAEIEALRTEFNALLEEIQRRDAELERTNAALKRLALRDPLTGLANRAMFESALLASLGRDARAGVGLLYFDLDAFKAVNDTFGHAAGDLLLRSIAARLEAHIPASAVAARMGGDEFVVVLPEIGTRDALAAAAERLQTALHAPLRVGAHILYPGLSVGYALSGVDADASRLVDLADQAMYASKQSRRDAGIRTRWTRIENDAGDSAAQAARRMRESGNLKILGERDVQQRSA